MSIEFVIERGVPPPLCRTGRPAMYAFERCEIGDSFLIPKDELPELYRSTLSQRVRWAIKRYRKDHPDTRWRVKTMSTGTRVWRVA